MDKVRIGPVFVTKYALTKGIIRYEEADDHGKSDGGRRMISIPGTRYLMMFYGDDWHDNEEAARLRVAVMRTAKRKSLEKQLAKLDKPVKAVAEKVGG